MRHVDEGRWELSPGDAAYPAQLAESPEAPGTLYVAGDPAALAPGLGVVGARRATPYGLWAARRFAAAAATHGATVVSGAAIGCDAAAQEAAVAAGGPSVAVLGCGADVVYPRSSAILLEHLRANSAVVSELPWGAPPQRWALQRRNRIIAGLSLAVLIVEAGLPSGTFSTADYALEAGRDVLVVPGSVRAPECRGTNRLLRQGATPVTDVSELLEELRVRGLGPAVAPHAPGGAQPDPRAGEEGAGDLVDSGGDELLRAIIGDPMRPDDLAWQLGLDVREVVVRLSQLEGAGLAARYPGGRYGSALPRGA
jgi:DNA processing protein